MRLSATIAAALAVWDNFLYAAESGHVSAREMCS